MTFYIFADDEVEILFQRVQLFSTLSNNSPIFDTYENEMDFKNAQRVFFRSCDFSGF